MMKKLQKHFISLFLSYSSLNFHHIRFHSRFKSIFLSKFHISPVYRAFTLSHSFKSFKSSSSFRSTLLLSHPQHHSSIVCVKVKDQIIKKWTLYLSMLSRFSCFVKSSFLNWPHFVQISAIFIFSWVFNIIEYYFKIFFNL